MLFIRNSAVEMVEVGAHVRLAPTSFLTRKRRTICQRMSNNLTLGARIFFQREPLIAVIPEIASLHANRDTWACHSSRCLNGTTMGVARLFRATECHDIKPLRLVDIVDVPKCLSEIESGFSAGGFFVLRASGKKEVSITLSGIRLLRSFEGKRISGVCIRQRCRFERSGLAATKNCDDL